MQEIKAVEYKGEKVSKCSAEQSRATTKRYYWKHREKENERTCLYNRKRRLHKQLRKLDKYFLENKEEENMKEEKQFKTLEGWKEHLKRDKTKEIEESNKRVGVVAMPIGDAMSPDLPEGELVTKRKRK